MIYHLQHLLSESASRDPEKDAVVCKEKRIRYGELEKTSNQLAYALRHNGLKPGDRVGIYLNKSVASIIGFFGALKAGGAYVPIDPQAPTQRLAYLLQDCGIRHLITNAALLGSVAEAARQMTPASLDCIVMAEGEASCASAPVLQRAIVPWSQVATSPELRTATEGIETDLAYILYTSGSTGRPKGVMISHLAAFTFIDWAHDRFRVCSADVVSNHAPLHFDLSVFDIYATVKAGGTMVLVPDGISSFPVKLSQFIAENRITIWYSVPSALVLMLTRGNFESRQYPDLRVILFAGEVFPVKYLRQLRQLLPRVEFHNLYGPTETNVCTYYEVNDVPADRVEPFPIGKAITNHEVFAVNDRGAKIGSGETGELYVRGPGLMLGYWGKLDKTNEVLVPNRFQPQFEEKMYRTGDLVRLDDDGNYIYVGRIDNMIKSRGYRIELGEIEAVLCSHPKIREAAVIAVPDEQVTNRLKAYVVEEGARTLEEPEVRRYCQDRIPKYMIPELVEFRDGLPKTSTGKIDRKSLALGG